MQYLDRVMRVLLPELMLPLVKGCCQQFHKQDRQDTLLFIDLFHPVDKKNPQNIHSRDFALDNLINQHEGKLDKVQIHNHDVPLLRE